MTWEEENFWNAIEVDDFSNYGKYVDCDNIVTKQQRNEKVKKQPQVRMQKVCIPHGGHDLVVGESVQAHFRARQGLMSKRVENAIVVSTLSSARVQLNFFKTGTQIIPTSWVIIPKSMPKAIIKALHPGRLRVAARRRSRMLAEELTCDAFC